MSASGNRILATSYPYSGKIIKVRLDKLALSEDQTALREVVEHPGAVAILALDNQNRVILIRQYRHPAATVLLEVPAGKLEPGEDPLACAQRELREETGYRGGKWKLLTRCYSSPGFCDELIHIFEARGLDLSTASPDEDEFIEVLHLSFQEALEMIGSGEIIDAKTIIALKLSSAGTV